jgi:hypothetical protein
MDQLTRRTFEPDQERRTKVIATARYIRELIDMVSFQSRRKHPSVSIQAEARIAFSKIIRELDFDVESSATASRPPALHSNQRR